MAAQEYSVGQWGLFLRGLKEFCRNYDDIVLHKIKLAMFDMRLLFSDVMR